MPSTAYISSTSKISTSASPTCSPECLYQVVHDKRRIHPAGDVGAPHHGSKTSSTDEFIAAVQPGYAVFTVGYRNRFGHPKQEVVQRYAGSGAQLLRSDEDGAILVEMNAQGVQVESYRKTHRRYWTHTPQHQGRVHKPRLSPVDLTGEYWNTAHHLNSEEQ